ncbi:MAG: hypothetical protein ACNA78_05280 [Balneolaceae bacterium]
MSTVTKYLIYGPGNTLRRLAPKMLEKLEPKYLYRYKSPTNKDEVIVAVYEHYEKQLNATITLTCVIENTESKTRIELKKAGGRMGFRGSSLSEEKNIESDVVDFVMDFTKRFGLSMQEEVPKPPPSDDDAPVSLDDEDED